MRWIGFFFWYFVYIIACAYANVTFNDVTPQGTTNTTEGWVALAVLTAVFLIPIFIQAQRSKRRLSEEIDGFNQDFQSLLMELDRHRSVDHREPTEEPRVRHRRHH